MPPDAARHVIRFNATVLVRLVRAYPRIWLEAPEYYKLDGGSLKKNETHTLDVRQEILRDGSTGYCCSPP